jgi:hypothetical protein
MSTCCPLLYRIDKNKALKYDLAKINEFLNIIQDGEKRGDLS